MKGHFPNTSAASNGIQKSQSTHWEIEINIHKKSIITRNIQINYRFIHFLKKQWQLYSWLKLFHDWLISWIKMSRQSRLTKCMQRFGHEEIIFCLREIDVCLIRWNPPSETLEKPCQQHHGHCSPKSHAHAPAPPRAERNEPQVCLRQTNAHGTILQMALRVELQWVIPNLGVPA